MRWSLLIMSGLVLSGMACSSSTPAPPPPPDQAFSRAVALCESQPGDALVALRVALQADADACQAALLEPAFAQSGLRDEDDFRDAVREASIRHGISSLTLAPEHEPGQWMRIIGRTVNLDGVPVPAAVVSIFATDDQGRYHPVIEGDHLPRIFGTVVSDDEGRFSFRTVRPGPYPGTRNARHVHISARAGDMRLAAPYYAVFDDDPLLDEPYNAEQRGEALRIHMDPAGQGEATGTITLPMR